jgi:hypothetical protein
MAIIIIKTRLIQLSRIIRQLGWLYTLIVTIVAVFSVWVLFNGEKGLNKAYIITGLGAMLPFGIHAGRGDKFFIYSISDKPYLIYFTEYLIVEFLPIFYLLVEQYYVLTSFLLLPPILLGMLPVGFFNKNRRKVSSSWPVGRKDFEWISGLRRSSPALAFIYLLAIISLAVPFLSLLFAWYLALSICSFYKESESLQMLLVNERTVNAFLMNKVMAHQKNYWKFILPIVAVYGLIHQNHWLIIVLFVVFVFLGLSFAVINKYSNYEPEGYSGNDLLNSLVFGSVFIPFLAPLPMVLLIRSTIKAKNNLRFYLKI